jgi:hypothetical protein
MMKKVEDRLEKHFEENLNKKLYTIKQTESKAASDDKKYKS